MFEQGDASRGIVACASCHGAGGSSTIPANPNLAAQSHEYLAKQLTDFQLKQGAKTPLRNGPEGNPTPMTAMAQNLTPADIAWVVPHQANERILKAVSRRVGISYDRFVMTMLNRKELTDDDFTHLPGGAVELNDKSRRTY